ncbi:MAG: prolipoprotein diacylglyceryl transferase [Sphingobacteriales bacterium]|nr:prolipoprotein diacylglyceryl transferase [Sphingobacteriales bacterium]
MISYPTWLPQQASGWYMFMVGVAAVMCSIFLLGYTLCRSKKMLNPVGVFFIVFVLTQIGLLGARVYSVFEDVILHFKSGEPLSNYPLRDKMNSGGFSYYGGLLLVMACIYGFSKWFSLKKLLEIADILAITVCIGYFFGRLGCQLSGDGCYGTYTTLPWGMHYIDGQYPSLLPAHPVPIYEMIVTGILFFYLLWLNERKQFTGQIFCLYLIISSLSRFMFEFIPEQFKISYWLNIHTIHSVSNFFIQHFIKATH